MKGELLRTKRKRSRRLQLTQHVARTRDGRNRTRNSRLYRRSTTWSRRARRNQKNKEIDDCSCMPNTVPGEKTERNKEEQKCRLADNGLMVRRKTEGTRRKKN
ncbi:hypothetical protein AVEN_164035-1 [Araneus ventricosus]|uniref:Uncharacterized protein n=1 Tax=Araneus ventricosus TaxID=182803 RepID=A0A4Y2VWX2_ARAVE|nr:hypothetical protein AVEN_164035-1 [Araneus ventricosus]